jgi:hypothetical protein
LAWTLLLSIPLEDGQHDNPALTDILRAAYLPARKNLRRSFFPYYAFIADVVIVAADTPRDDDTFFHGRFLAVFPNIIKHLNQPQVRETLAATAQPGGRFHSAKTVEYMRAVGLVLRKDFTWFLCTNNAEHIRSVVIPLSDISRYFSLVGRLKVLSNITFFIDLQLQLHNRERSRFSPQELETLERQLEDRARHLDEMIRFVQKLRQCHPHIHMAATCPRPGNRRDICPENYQDQLLQCLPPLNSPSIVNKSNWLQFAAKVQETDLSRIKVLFQEPPFCGFSHVKQLAQWEPFLHRCCSLDSIDIYTWSEDLFQWAANERRNATVEIAAGRKLTMSPPVPLRLAKINCGPQSDGRQVDDLMIGFSETLESLDITSHFQRDPYAPASNDPLPEFKVGSRGGDVARYCKLVRLTRFTISTRNHFLRVDSFFLHRLPSVEYLVLKHTRERYSVNEIACWSPTPGILPRLVHINLEGTPAISFHPDTLHHTPNLVYLKLGLLSAITSHIFIPHAGDLDDVGQEEDGAGSPASMPMPTTQPLTKSIWSWNWELRKLGTLELNSVFAYKFQFRLLEKTPNLRMLALNINTQERQHPRTIRLCDLPLVSNSTTAITLVSSPPTVTVTPQPQEQNESTIDQKLREHQQQHQQRDLQNDEHVRLPLLESLYMNGDWSLSNEVLSVMFREMMPNIARLMMRGGCRGFTLEGWIKETSGNLHSLTSALCSTEVYATAGPAELEALGLGKVDGGFRWYPCYHLVVVPKGRKKELLSPVDYEFG